MAANKSAYRAVIGHVPGIPSGEHFLSRMEAKKRGLTKEEQRGISWGLDKDGVTVADAIVLNKGYEDDHDTWDEIRYTGAGGRNTQTKKQEADQSWEYDDNAAVKMSYERKYPVRVLRGYRGEEPLSPASGYRYDGLYAIEDCAYESGLSGLRICRIVLRRLEEDEQELTPLENQLQEMVKGEAPRKTSTVTRVVRDTAVARRVKRKHGNTCQVCRIALPVGPGGASYAEGAHIQPLGKHGRGPDIDSNVLCLCPNCHIRFDRGAIYLTDDLEVVDRFAEDRSQLHTKLRTVVGHHIEKEYVRVHRHLLGIDGC
jgi:putative restriction endonuclease